MELQQDHCRTLVQVDRLKRALDEHSLELRVKAANEAEAACQQRLAAAEAEIAKHRQRLDDSERFHSILWISFTIILFSIFCIINFCTQHCPCCCFFSEISFLFRGVVIQL